MNSRGRRGSHRIGMHVPKPHGLHTRGQNEECVRKLRLTSVNAVPKTAPSGSGSAVLDFVTESCSAQSFCRQHHYFMTPLSSWRDAPFTFATISSVKAGNAWLPKAPPAPSRWRSQAGSHSKYRSKTLTLVGRPLWPAWARDLGHRRGARSLVGEKDSLSDYRGPLGNLACS